MTICICICVCLYLACITKKYANSLTYLDLSDNSLGKAGTAACVTLCDSTPKVLAHVNVQGCDIEIKNILTALLVPHHGLQNLSQLNLSNNKFGNENKTCGLLCDLISSTNSINNLVLKEFRFSSTSFVRLFESVFNNPNFLDFRLNLSGNDFGAKGAASLLTLLTNFPEQEGQKFQTHGKLHSLELHDNNFGYDGLTKLVQALTSKVSLRVLGVDRNIKPGFFSEVTQQQILATSLAQLVNNPITGLSSLSVAGNGSSHYCKDFISVFRALSKNTTLTSLTVSGNKLGEENLTAFSETVAVNTALERVKIDENKWTINDLKKFSEAMSKNNALVNLELPFVDIEKLFSSAKGDPNTTPIIYILIITLFTNQRMMMMMMVCHMLCYYYYIYIIF